MAPRKRLFFADMGVAANLGVVGICQAFEPEYGWGTGTCCCQFVMPTIMLCGGRPLLSTR